MKKLALISCLAAGLLITAGVRPAAAAVVEFSPSANATVALGDLFDIDVLLSDLDANGEIGSAFDLDISFDNVLLSATGVSFGAPLGDDGAFEAIYSSAIDNGIGIVDIAGVSLLSDDELALRQGDSVTLATIAFEAVGSGDVAFDFLFGAGNDVKGRNNQVIVPMAMPMPAPAGLSLVALGLVGLRLTVRRKKA